MAEDQRKRSTVSFAEILADERKREGFRQFLMENEVQCEDFIQMMISAAIEQLNSDPPERELPENGMAWAEWAANQARHWADIAKCWSREFHDRSRIGVCLFNGHSIAAKSPMVPTVDSVFREVNAGEEEVLRLEFRMVPTMVFSYVLAALTQQPAPSFSGMKSAENLAESYGNSTGEPTKTQIGNTHRARQLSPDAFVDHYGKAESQLGWLYIAKTWFEDWDSWDEATRCLKRAEELAADMATIQGWVEVARLWMRVLEEPNETLRCVAEAEMLPESNTAQDFISLAEGRALTGQPELAGEYLDRAESLAFEPSEWSAIASVWQGLGYWDRAERAEDSSSVASDEEPVIYRDSKGRFISGGSRR